MRGPRCGCRSAAGCGSTPPLRWRPNASSILSPTDCRLAPATRSSSACWNWGRWATGCAAAGTIWCCLSTHAASSSCSSRSGWLIWAPVSWPPAS
ncbi:hypothetical protein G6F60_015586 [Rhizopus arrhizus]|nr:hypothetical protein G6F60_015586 [Rhizopus arrhizus]